jgi:hypothetical protein
MDDTGPINLLPGDDPFWEDQPRDTNGRWAVKEKRLNYDRLAQPEPLRGRVVDISGGNGAAFVFYPEGHSTFVAVPPRRRQPEQAPRPRRRRRG